MFPSNKNVITNAPSTLVPYSTPEAKLLQKQCNNKPDSTLWRA
jgi:hypothetical protein